MKVSSCSRGGAFLVWALAIQMVLGVSGTSPINHTNSCKLSSESVSERKVLTRLESLTQKNFTLKTKTGADSYEYVFQLCGDAGGVPGAGLVQIDKLSAKTVIGRYNATQAIGGSDWVMLIYGSGEKYDQHCNKNYRKAIVMISCTGKADAIPLLNLVLEDRERTEDCFYLFEMDSNAVCPEIQSQLSAGSIILIIGFCLLAVYLLGGFLYQRLIVGAKGKEQFPNYAFWVEDGCDFVCRSQNREASPAYRGLPTEPLEEEESEERDDHLLPM